VFTLTQKPFVIILLTTNSCLALSRYFPLLLFLVLLLVLNVGAILYFFRNAKEPEVVEAAEDGAATAIGAGASPRVTGKGSPSPAAPPSKPPMGASMPNVPLGETTESLNCWSVGDATLHQVRMQGYSSHKKKGPSEESPYECVAMDLYRDPKRICNLASQIVLPQPDPEDPRLAGPLPYYFIVHIQIPHEGPSMMKAAGEEGVSLAFFFRVKTEFQQQAQEGTGSNGLKYLVNYVQKAPTDPTVQHCFKAVPFVDNIKDLGLGSVASYNGKPALIKKTGQIFQDESRHYFEMQINVHSFGIMTRSALGNLKSRFQVRFTASCWPLLLFLLPLVVPSVSVSCLSHPPPTPHPPPSFLHLLAPCRT
jgi:hypothetical protein